MSNMNYKGLLSVTTIASAPLDIRCPSHRIQDDMLDQAFQHIIVPHGDLQYLRRFPWRVFSVLPGLIKKAVSGVTSTDNITRRDC